VDRKEEKTKMNGGRKDKAKPRKFGWRKEGKEKMDKEKKRRRQEPHLSALPHR
jgi:hypothetical protein